jgi:hypothetical protein
VPGRGAAAGASPAPPAGEVPDIPTSVLVLAGWRPRELGRTILVSGSMDDSRQREMVMTMSETPATPEAGPKAGAATRWAGPRTRSAPPPAGGAVYGLGMIGALVYFLGTSASGRDYVLAVGKASVWPALLVYKAFKSLGD